ncbi:MAG: hypothetical protein KAI47_24020, partial [Deltaproteobacteria bacterium]|nr:hypothetical protein [Deltaproteobacteria bacterium]
KPLKNAAKTTAPKTDPAAAKKAKREGAKRWAALLGLGQGDNAKIPAEATPNTPAKAGVATSLAQAAARFTTFDACLRETRQRLPPELGADLLRNKNLPDGICRTREALAHQDVTACKRAVSYGIRRACKVMYGIYHGKPELCPLGYPKRRGRDAYCLAVAQRDLSLCQASKTQAQETRCRAILTHDESPCATLRRPADRSACQAEVRRWAGLIQAPSSPQKMQFSPRLHLKFAIRGSNRPLPFTEVDAPCARYGVVAPEVNIPGVGRSGIGRPALGRPSISRSSVSRPAQVNACEYSNYGYRSRPKGRSSLSSRSFFQRRRTKVDLSFTPPLKPTDTIPFGDDAHLKIRLSSLGEFRSDKRGAIRFSHFERRRGGRVTATFNATLVGLRGATLDVKGTLDTFVRDLVPASKMARRRRYGRGTYKRGTYGRAPILGQRGRGLSGSYRPGAYRPGRLGGAGTSPPRRYAALFTSARFIPTTVGRRHAFRFTSIRPNSVWDRLKLQDGDVVFRIGSVKLTNEGSIVRLRRELQDAKTLKILLRRGKLAKVLHVSAKELGALRQEFRL